MRRLVLLLSLLLSVLLSHAAALTGLRLTWRQTSGLQVALAERSLRAGLRDLVAPNASADAVTVARVTVLSGADADLLALPPTSPPFNSTFAITFNVSTNASDAVAAAIANANATVVRLSAWLAADVVAAVANSSVNASDEGSWGQAAPLYRLLRGFSLDNVNVSAVNASELATPVLSEANDNMTATVSFRNIVDTAELGASLRWQTRAGLARFLASPLGWTASISANAAISSLGSPETALNSVLLVTHRFRLALNSLTSTAAFNTSTSVGRKAIATLIAFGDPSRPLADGRPSMFIDYVVPRLEIVEALNSDAIARTPSFLRALYPFVFGGVEVADALLATIQAAEINATLVDQTSLIPAVSVSELGARRRQRFRFDPTAYAAILPTNLTYPPDTSTNSSSNTSTATTPTCGFAYCTSIYWRNAVGRAFWLESIESVEAVAWDLFPTASLCSAASSPSPFEPVEDDEEAALAWLPAPMLQPGETATPVWTLGSTSGFRLNKLDVALNLRSVDGATLLKVEVATDMQSALDAGATVTSIARLANATAANATIFNSTSNLAVRTRTRLHSDGGGRSLLLFLELVVANVTAKDTSKPCGHCQSLFDWCANEANCSALRQCVSSAAGLDTLGTALLANSSSSNATATSADLWPVFEQCLTPAVAQDAQFDAAMILASAVRCQMQRLCPFLAVAAAFNASGAVVQPERILVWESSAGRHRVRVPVAVSAVNMTLRVGNQTLCSLPLTSTTTAAMLEDFVVSNCRFAKYLGRVVVSIDRSGSVALLTATNTSAINTSTLYDSFDITYKYVVGPMPTLVAPSTSANVTVAVMDKPRVVLRADEPGYATRLPPLPAPLAVPPTDCEVCSRLALDLCLRDGQCIAMTDCIMRFDASATNSSTASANATATTGDLLFNVFQQQVVGSQFSLMPAVNACHSANLSVDASWLQLVRASACFSRTGCPVSLTVLLPEVTTAVGRWRVLPERRQQKLYYYAANSSAAATDRVPIVLTSNGVVVKEATSATDAATLEAKLRKLLAVDDISVALENASDLEKVWTISYGHWVGALPRFVPDDRAPTWTLATITAMENATLEMVAINATNTSNSSTTVVV